MYKKHMACLYKAVKIKVSNSKEKEENNKEKTLLLMCVVATINILL